MNIRQVTDKLINNKDLTREEMASVMAFIMSGKATDVQIAGFLVALKIKGETIDEIQAAASVMRDLSIKVDLDSPALDIVGTGGDGSKIFNVSTASSFIAAAAGAKVAKHGGRSVSSSSGSSDLLEIAGARLDLDSQQVKRCVEETGLGFMFAVNHHASMKYAVVARKELAIRTLFNLLGPLTNPASTKHQLIGVYDQSLVMPFAEVLKSQGSEHALVVCSDDGLDELSIASATLVAELKAGNITQYKVTPESLGLRTHTLDDLKVDSPTASLALIKQALTEVDTPASDMLALNAGAAIYAADITLTMEEGVVMAQDIMASGLAMEKFREFVEFTQYL